jgi:NitT/TauT family transport system substrate-binding protein
MKRLILPLLVALSGMVAAHSARAADTLKLAVGAPGNWDTAVPDVGIRAGIFAKYNLEIQAIYTNGGGETLQAVNSGSVDLGIGAGTAGVMGAFVKGAPVRILLAGTTGTRDLYWYVPAASPIKSFKDVSGKTVAYSTNGASTHTTLLAILKAYNSDAKPVSTGSGSVTLTQALTGQVDVGWASPPFGLDQLDEGKIRMIGNGDDAPSMREQTVRVHIVNADVLKSKADAIARFVAAYRETYDYLYDNPEGVKHFVAYSKVSEKLAVRIRDEILTKAAMNPDKVSGLDAIMADAITFKVIAAPLTKEQVADLLQIPAKK